MGIYNRVEERSSEMVIEKASEKETDALVVLRLAYLQEDLGTVSAFLQLCKCFSVRFGNSSKADKSCL